MGIVKAQVMVPSAAGHWIGSAAAKTPVSTQMCVHMGAALKRQFNLLGSRCQPLALSFKYVVEIQDFKFRC